MINTNFDSPRPLRVLVTGGSGFVGSAVVAELTRRGHQVVATTTRSTGLSIARNLCWVRWNALNEPLPQVNWNDLQVIVHLAAPTRPFDCPAQSLSLYELGVAASFRLLEIARREGVRRILIASTGDVLGSRLRPACEDDVLYEPTSFYGTVKACSELLLRSYKGILSTAVLRFYHPYGRGGASFLVNRLIKSVADGQEVQIQGTNGIILNPVWIDDVASGVCLAVESDEPGIFHFGGPETVTLRELLETIGTLVNKKPIIRITAEQCIQRHAGSWKSTHRVLNYNPKVSLKDGIRNLLESST